MRVTSVELHPDGSNIVCELSFRDPTRENPYNVKGITGLDADEIVPRFYGVPGSTAFYNMMLVRRNIVALIELNPDFGANQSFASLRDDLYRMIASSRKGKLEVWFKDGDTVMGVVSGFVTKLEAAHFTKSPEVQISIECDEPFIKAPDRVFLDVESLDDPNLAVISNPLSTAPHGFQFEIAIGGFTSSLTIDDPNDPDWSFTVTPSGGFLTDDVLYFSSEYNNKYIWVVRGGNPIYLADAIISGSIWPILFPGDNNIRMAGSLDLSWQALSYFPTYWGV